MDGEDKLSPRTHRIEMSNVLPEWYQLRDALYEADYSSAASLLQEHPHLLSERNGIGETVLHFLAVENCLGGIRWLHARGASLNSTNKFGTPLLFEAAQLKYRELVAWLLDQGADVKQRDSGNRSIQEYLTAYETPDMVAFVNEHVSPSE
jgi:ankyrin repeat protein